MQNLDPLTRSSVLQLVATNGCRPRYESGAAFVSKVPARNDGQENTRLKIWNYSLKRIAFFPSFYERAGTDRECSKVHTAYDDIFWWGAWVNVARRPDSLKCFKVIVGKKKTKVRECNLEVSLETKFFLFSVINLTPWLSTFLETFTPQHPSWWLHCQATGEENYGCSWRTTSHRWAF